MLPKLDVIVPKNCLGLDRQKHPVKDCSFYSVPNRIYPLLDTRIVVLPFVRPSHSGYAPADFETGWTGELWSNANLL